MATNNNYLYITTNQFSASGSCRGDVLTIVPYGTTGSKVSITLNSDSYQPAVISDGTSAQQFFVSHNGSNHYIIGYTGIAKIFTKTITGMSSNGTFTEKQQEVTNTLDAPDGRMTSSAYDARNNTLNAVLEAASTNGVATDELVQIKNLGQSNQTVTMIALNSVLTAKGLPSVDGSFNGSVAVDNNGDVLVNFNVSGTNVYPADYYAVWNNVSGGAPTITSEGATLVDYQNSTASYIDPARYKVGRWDDYSTALADPSMANGFFISNEYVTATSTWNTALVHVTV